MVVGTQRRYFCEGVRRHRFSASLTEQVPGAESEVVSVLSSPRGSEPLVSSTVHEVLQPGVDGPGERRDEGRRP